VVSGRESACLKGHRERVYLPRDREELIGPMAAKPTATGDAPQKSRKKWRETNREKIT
jgi:hypothetical protein